MKCEHWMSAALVAVVVSVPMRWAAAEEPLTLENVVAPAANTADEPLAEQFSLTAATRFLDAASLEWTKSRKCFACHTNYSYLMARPMLSAEVKAHEQVRQSLEQMIEQRWGESGPRWDAEVVMSAAMLAFNDHATTGKLHATTRKALDRMWTVQREDGGFSWLKCNWPPMESDDHYGATMALIGVGMAPEDYAKTPAAQAGIAKLRAYLTANPPPTAHHRAMVLWAATCVEGILEDGQRQAIVKELSALQKDDGGWALAALGDWQRADGTAQDTTTSDAYATGLMIYVLRRAGVAASDPAVQRGIQWLKSHQRQSGRWFTRSLNKDSKHFISHAGTAFAVLALASCGEIDRP
jgi:squalene-hopene/tetraprenyl-beta-curcumene cyclase